MLASDLSRPRPVRTVRRRLAVATAATTLGLGLAVGLDSPAQAHDVLVGSNPADGATLDRAPSVVVLTFEEPALALGTKVVITGPDGSVSAGGPRLVGSTVRQRVDPDAPAGGYTVAWRVTSDDGHPVTGTFRFTVTSASASPSTSPSTGVSPSATATAAASPSSVAPSSVAPSSPSAAPSASSTSSVPVGLGIGLGVLAVAGGIIAVVRRSRTGGR